MSLESLVCSFFEQKKIANFLDEKSKIFDEAISKKEQLISKLELAKQSLISEVVTGKLKIVEQNSKLQSIKREKNELKPSGVEWLGDIPKDWKIHKLRYGVERIGDIDHDMPKSVSIGKPYLMTGDISEKVSLIDFSNTKQVSEEDFLRLSRKIKPNKGDIIFARYATIGTVCYVDIEKDFLVSYSCVTIKTITKKVFGEYLFYFFKSNFFLEEIKSYINSNTQGNVGIDSLYKTKLILPKIEEQQKISKYLDEKLIHFDNTIEKTKQSIKKLKLAKEALISQAVTGKIEVL